MANKRTIRTWEGNTKAIPFRLRVADRKENWDVSSALAIVLEGELEDGTVLTPVACDRAHPDADWVNGKVVAVISVADFTQRVGTNPWSLTVTIGGEELTVEDGDFEVVDRPGYTPPP